MGRKEALIPGGSSHGAAQGRPGPTAFSAWGQPQHGDVPQRGASTTKRGQSRRGCGGFVPVPTAPSRTSLRLRPRHQEAAAAIMSLRGDRPHAAPERAPAPEDALRGAAARRVSKDWHGWETGPLGSGGDTHRPPPGPSTWPLSCAHTEGPRGSSPRGGWRGPPSRAEPLQRRSATPQLAEVRSAGVSEPHGPQASLWAALAVQAAPARVPTGWQRRAASRVCVGSAGAGHGPRRKQHLPPSMTTVHGPLGSFLPAFPYSLAAPALAHQRVT